MITADGDIGFSPELAAQVEAMPELDPVSSVRYGNMRIDGSTKQVVGADLTVLTELMAVDVQAGDPVAAADPGSIIMTQEAADDNGVALGDSITVEFAATGEQTLTVGAIYDNEFLIGHYLIDLSAWETYFDSTDDSVISAAVAPGVDPAAAAAALAPFENEFPQLNFETARRVRRPGRGPARLVPDHHQRVPRAGDRDRPARHHQHDGAVGARTHPGDRPDAGRRHDPPPDEGHDPTRSGRRVAVRRPARRGRRAGVRLAGGVWRSPSRSSTSCRSRR